MLNERFTQQSIRLALAAGLALLALTVGMAGCGEPAGPSAAPPAGTEALGPRPAEDSSNPTLAPMPEVDELPRTDESVIIGDTVLPSASYTCLFDPFAPISVAMPGCPQGERPPSGVPTFDAPAGLGVEEVKRNEVSDDFLRFDGVLPEFLPANAHFYMDRQLLGISAADTAFGRLFIVEGPIREDMRAPDPKITPGVRKLGDETTLSGWTYISGKNRVLAIETTGGARVTVFVQGTAQPDSQIDELFAAVISAK